MPHEVIMPALGMTQDSGVIVAWRKTEGDPVAIGDPLFDVETDKTTMEVEAAHAGFLTEIRADAGADIPVGQTIALIAEVPTEASGDAGPNLVPEPATAVETKPPTSSPRPTAPTLPEPPAPRSEPAAPSTPSVAPTILASPKARFEAHRRGIDLRRLVDQGIPQPFHVADLDQLKAESGTVGPAPQASILTASFAWSAFNDFIAWAEGKTGEPVMRHVTLAAFAVRAFRAEVRPGKADSLTISVLSVGAKPLEFTLRDPDLLGLGNLTGSALRNGDTRADLTLIDLCGTRLIDYRPAAQPGLLSVVVMDSGSDEASVNLHFCEDDLPLIAAARFLDSFAARAAEPILQLL